METATARRKKPKSWTGRRPNVGAKRLNNPTTQRCIELPVVAGRPCYKVQDMVPNEDVPILDHELWMRNEHMSTGRGSANKAQGVKALGRGGGQGGFSWRSLRPGGSLLCARSPAPYVLSYVLLLVQMAGGGPLMRLFFISVCYL